MALGVLGLGLAGLVFGMYFRQQGIGPVWYLFFTFLLFGLNKWEMLTNGTGWGISGRLPGFIIIIWYLTGYCMEGKSPMTVSSCWYCRR